jgi:hypothetical protein
MEINRFDLFNHYKTRKLTVLWHGYMKGEAALRVGDRTDNRQPSAFIKQVFADHESGTAAFLFMTGLWIKSERNDVSLSRDISRHLPDLLAG